MRAIKNIIGSVFISIAALAFWVFILPGYETQSYLEALVEARTSAITTKSDLIKKVADLNNVYQDKFNELKRLSLVVPDEKNIAEVIVSIEDISSQSGVNMTGISISEAPAKAKNYGVLALDLNFSGTYDAIMSLLDHIEKHIRLIDVDVLALSIDETIQPKQIILIGNIKASAYFLGPQEKAKSVTKVESNDASQ